MIARRAFCAAASALLCAPLASFASDYTGTVRILVGFPPGGATDVVARILADKLRESLRQPVIVDNRPGAGGTTVTQQLKTLPADGSVVLLTLDGPHVVAPMTLKERPYDATTDFTPVAGVARYYNSLAVTSAINVRTLGELGTWLKANPSKASFGTPSVGSVPHFAGLVVAKALGAEMVNVPYRGGAPLVQDLLGGQVPAGVGSLTEFIEHHRGGKMRVLAVSGMQRSRIAPDVPTFNELGIKGIDHNPWLGFFGPKGLPREFVTRFSAGVAAALQQPDVVEKLSKMGNEVQYMTPEQLQDLVTTTANNWGPVIRDSGYQLR